MAFGVFASAGPALAGPGFALSVTKTPSQAIYTAAGQTITYTYVVSETDPDPSSTAQAITVTDDKIPTVTCPSTTLAVLGSMTCTGTYTTTAADITAGSVTNTVTVNGLISLDVIADTATASTTVTFKAQPSWTLTKVADPTSYTAAGQAIAYSYTLTNTGNVSISGITVSDDKIATVTCAATTLAIGASTTCSGVYSTAAADVTAGSLTNHATAHGTPASGILTDAKAQATITFSSKPSWTFTKTASPATYTAAGQTIAYSYTLTNTGNVAISGIGVSDDKIVSVTCAATALAVGANTGCWASYTVTAADVTAGSVTNTATAHGTPASGSLNDATAQATVNYKAPLKGSITIVETALSGDAGFQFSSTLPGVGGFSLTTTDGSASRVVSGLASGTYVVRQVSMPFDWQLTALSCIGDKGGKVTVANLANGSVSIGLDGGEAITCTFVNTFDTALHRQKTQNFIRNFLGRRLRQLAEDEPDRARFVRRVPGSLWGDDDGAPFDLSGDTRFASSNMSFSTSLSRIAHTGGKGNPLSRALANSGIDVWMEGHFSELRDAAASNRFGILYLGADYLVTPSVLVGALVQRDWTLQLSQDTKSKAQGGGFMAGPYVSARLTPQLFVDARAAWGTSNNSVDPFGLYTDRFKTDRWLANTRLTGNFHVQKFRVTPSIDVSYLEDHQQGYTDSLGIFIPGQTVALGRLRFGPEISRRYPYSDGTSVEPELSLSGEWDFKNPDVIVPGSFYVRHAVLHARIQAGLQVHGGDGLSVRVMASYDGLGTSSFSNFGAQFWIFIPVN